MTDTPLSINTPLTIDFGKNTTFDRALIQENIMKGQRIEQAKLEYWNGADWQLIQEFTTVGHKRLLRFEAVTARKVRFTVLAAKTDAVFISEVGFFKASLRE